MCILTLLPEYLISVQNRACWCTFIFKKWCEKPNTRNTKQDLLGVQSALVLFGLSRLCCFALFFNTAEYMLLKLARYSVCGSCSTQSNYFLLNYICFSKSSQTLWHSELQGNSKQWWCNQKLSVWPLGHPHMLAKCEDINVIVLKSSFRRNSGVGGHERKLTLCVTEKSNM